MPEQQVSRAARRPPTVRCAIYTRKSSEEGLEQDFNSLHAQREACEAYIVSQKHEGWIAVPTRYDDGGLSGGTMERPALRRLLQDIGEGGIDVIVVYKVDRLTRALSDFARIVDIFDRHEVSFISVTQLFNTTTSMGRLTLNVLLSFAQFEREVTGERIRDKIAASKKKGMWMGGNPPLGYDARDRKLVVNEAEAATVRHLFALYRQIKSVRELRHRLEAEGISSKRRVRRDGSVSGGNPSTAGPSITFCRTASTSGKSFTGTTPIRGNTRPSSSGNSGTKFRRSWPRMPTGNAGERRAGPVCLTGLLFDEEGGRLSPSHAVKQGRRYRYYVSRHLIVEGRKPNRMGWRIPAADLENLVLGRIHAWLSDPVAVSEVIQDDLQDASVHAALVTNTGMLAQRWPELSPEETRAYLDAFVSRIVIKAGSVVIEIDPEHVVGPIMDGPPAVPAAKPREGRREANHPVVLVIPATLKRAGIGIRLVVSRRGK